MLYVRHACSGDVRATETSLVGTKRGAKGGSTRPTTNAHSQGRGTGASQRLLSAPDPATFRERDLLQVLRPICIGQRAYCNNEPAQPKTRTSHRRRRNRSPQPPRRRAARLPVPARHAGGEAMDIPQRACGRAGRGRHGRDGGGSGSLRDTIIRSRLGPRSTSGTRKRSRGPGI